MSELYVCKQYETPYERVCKIITTLEEHDKQIRADERAKVLEEVIKTLGNDYWNIAKIQELKRGDRNDNI